jgi:hypothetical protein
VAFFRSLGGAVGVSALGAVLSSSITSSMTSGLAHLGIKGAALSSGSGRLPDVHTLPGPVRAVVEHAYGSGVGEIFLVAAPMGVIAFLAILLLKEVPLGTVSGVQAAASESETASDADAEVVPAEGEPVAA